MDEAACAELIKASRIIRSELGGDREATQEEGVTIDFAFASVVTIQRVSAGEPFTGSNIWVKRPGKGGIPAEQYESILTRRATRDIEADVQLQPGDYE
jgi:sialic acid synthase SpsE